MKMVKLLSPMLASVTMCNDENSNYNSKISGLGYLTPLSKGWCLCRVGNGVYVEQRVVFKWPGPSYTSLRWDSCSPPLTSRVYC